MTLLAATGPSAYWYLARGSGVVALVLLTASVVLGVLDSLRFAAAPRWPRFAIDAVHRDISLLVLALLGVHVVTSVLDSFAPIRLIDAVLPFTSRYRPLWLGLGALAFDLLLALALTSLVRRRVGYRAWRAIHWLAYASWPVAVLHGLGTGSDTKQGWSLVVTVACLGAVVAAVLVRVARARGADPRLRRGATALAIATPVGLAIFTMAGPLEPGWARRAGTPATLLAKTGYVAGRAAAPAAFTLRTPFSARLSGTLSQRSVQGGAVIDLSLRVSGGARGRLRVRMGGAPLAGGGLSLTGSQVALSAVGLPSAMQGPIVSLQGQQFLARVSNGSGTVWDLRASLSIDPSSNAVTGSLSATDAGA